MQIKAKKVGATLLSALITVFIYILLHDSIFTAHVRGIGGNYTNLSNLWLHANGALLPVIVALIYALFYKKDTEGIFYYLFSYMFLLVPIASLFAWVIIPFLYIQERAPVGDDVTNFLFYLSNEKSITSSLMKREEGGLL